MSELITLDGVVEAPGGEPGFKYTGWSGEYFDEAYLKFKLKEVLEVGALLLGRVTYQGFAEAWPSRTDEWGFADQMNRLPKHVVSTTLGHLEWNNSTLIRNNVVDNIRQLKSQPGGDILVTGSGTLAQTLMQHELVDEYRFMMHPTILGIGRRLYQEIGERKKLRLVEVKTFGTGTLVLIYQPENLEP